MRRCATPRPDLVVSFYGERAFVIGHVVLKGLGIRTALRVLPTSDRWAWVRRSRAREAVKAALFHSADAAKVPGPDGLEYAVRHGLPAERVAFVTQSIDVERYRRRLPADQRVRERARFGVSGECLFLYAGRFWSGKGLPVLLDAYRQAKAAYGHIRLLLVGDGEDDARLRETARALDGVAFHPFVQADELARYYAAADVFVFPTLGDRHGLVIEEAQAAGLPVIATDAIGDVRRRVVDGEMGFIVPAGDASSLATRMADLARNEHMRKVLGAAGAERAARCGHDVWAADFERFVHMALTVAPRTTAAARMTTAAGAAMLSCAA